MSSTVLTASSVRGRAIAFQHVRHSKCSRRCITTKAVGWDPENILGAPVGGHINRRQMQKQMGNSKEMAASIKLGEEKQRNELIAKRESRKLPETPAEMIEFLLNTEGDEMEFEIARNKPNLDKGFFLTLDSVIGQERFAARPNEDRLAELETLRTFVADAVAVLEKKAASTASAGERMKRLLSAPDKKACILDMVSNNEIDQSLMDLLQQSIDQAKLEGQDKPAEFMEKVRNACKKYMITV